MCSLLELLARSKDCQQTVLTSYFALKPYFVLSVRGPVRMHPRYPAVLGCKEILAAFQPDLF